MEDECYRIVAMKQLRKSMDPKSVNCDHVPDIVSFEIVLWRKMYFRDFNHYIISLILII